MRCIEHALIALILDLCPTADLLKLGDLGLRLFVACRFDWCQSRHLRGLNLSMDELSCLVQVWVVMVLQPIQRHAILFGGDWCSLREAHLNLQNLLALHQWLNDEAMGRSFVGFNRFWLSNL